MAIVKIHPTLLGTSAGEVSGTVRDREGHTMKRKVRSVKEKV
jgi:hypothetical protein